MIQLMLVIDIEHIVPKDLDDVFGSKHLRLFTAYYHHYGEEYFRVAM